MEPGFHVDAAPGRLVLKGELDCESASVLAAAVASLNGAEVQVDLSGVTFIDSSGLESLLLARRHHAGLRIVNPSASISRLLELTGLHDLVE